MPQIALDPIVDFYREVVCRISPVGAKNYVHAIDMNT